jgi:beta-N-acetylglucosaminidase
MFRRNIVSSPALKMETACFSKMLVSTWRQNPEDHRYAADVNLLGENINIIKETQKLCYMLVRKLV